MKQVKIKIDNKELCVDYGKTVLEAALEASIAIPSLCYNKNISHNTSCFVCMVKDAKTGRYIPSCSLKAEEGMEFLSNVDEINDMRQAALNLLLSEHSGDCEAPCTIACPAHAAVEEYVRQGREGLFLEALKTIKQRIPLPMSIGRVCPRFCEKDCRRNVQDEAVAINDFKRLAADLHYADYIEDFPPLNEKRIAIIGSGPAGLAAAYYLREQGISSDIYEKMPKAGGMLRYGIPEFRLPKNILDTELAHFSKLGGITFLHNQELGKEISTSKLCKDYDAVIVALGSWKSSSARIEGEDHCASGIQWLEKLSSLEEPGKNPGKTIVIGGGNTAMDCVRTAVRLSAPEVICLYRRTEKEMPAEPIEIHEAKEEGVIFQFLTAPIKLEEKQGKKIITCQKMELGEPDASGRRRPVPVPDSEFTIEADTVIAAIGQATDVPESEHSVIAVNKWGDVAAHETNMQVAKNLFAAGDCVTGPATVVEAVAAGRRAALSAAAFIDGKDYAEMYTINVSRGYWQHLKMDNLVLLKDLDKRGRTKLHLIDVERRKTNLEEVSLTMTEAEIKEEGQRCFECSCTDKTDCHLKTLSETYRAEYGAIHADTKLCKVDTRHHAIALDSGKCIKCGICVKVCKDMVNQSLLGFKNRGYSTVVGTAFAETLPSSCDDCRECVKSCPTGALAFKEKNAI